MSIPEAIGLGVLQGLTEFLPVSSSGHLALAEHFLGVRSPGIAFEVFAHFGTALAVIVFFRRRVASIVVALVRALVGASHEPAEARLGVRLAVGTVPAVVVGYLSNDQIKSAFANPTLVSGLLVLTGCVLWLTRRLSPGARPVESLRDALVIGMAQAVAILPGISRSGSTISAGLALGVQREQAAEFAFLLSIPVILGATAASIGDAWGAGGALLPTVAAGTAAAFVSAMPAVAVLMRVVSVGNLYRFAYYCWAVGIAGLILSLLGA